MDWALFAIGVTSAIFALSLFAARKRMTCAGFFASLPQFLVAMLNGAAPVRSIMDPDYVGYTFGMLHADKGMPVMMMSGGIYIAAIVSGLLCMFAMNGPAMIFVAAFDLFVLAIIGIPMVQTMMTDPSQFIVQAGEYFTMSPMMSVAAIVVLVVIPLLLVVYWAGKRAGMKSTEAK